MNAELVTIAKQRLRLGISNVGFWVVAASLGLVWLKSGNAPILDWRRLVMIFGLMLFGQAGFDYLGGQRLLPTPRPAPTEFLRSWWRGFLVQTIALLLLVLLNLACFKITAGFCWAVATGMGLLAVSRKQILRLATGITLTPSEAAGGKYLAAETSEAAFSGGIIGFGAGARSLMPARWLKILPAQELETELFRRQWQIQKGLPLRSFLVLLLWNLSGCTVGKHLLNLPGRAPGEALFGHVCFMTLWSFLGLLILPRLSREAVLAADRAAAAAGLDIESWIRRFPDLVGEDGSDRGAVQNVFYPIPSAEIRLNALNRDSSHFGPGNLARNNLYYSWATLTLLGRAVHCNAGRPALWVFPPSD